MACTIRSMSCVNVMIVFCMFGLCMAVFYAYTYVCTYTDICTPTHILYIYTHLFVYLFINGWRPMPPAPLLGGLVVWWLGGVSVRACGGLEVRRFVGLTVWWLSGLERRMYQGKQRETEKVGKEICVQWLQGS